MCGCDPDLPGVDTSGVHPFVDLQPSCGSLPTRCKDYLKAVEEVVVALHLGCDRRLKTTRCGHGSLTYRGSLLIAGLLVDYSGQVSHTIVAAHRQDRVRCIPGGVWVPMHTVDGFVLCPSGRVSRR